MEQNPLDESIARDTLIEWLGIEFLELDKNCVMAKMPVDHRTYQPAGLLHGGASAALAETVSSIGSWLNVDRNRQTAVGMEINANHLRSVRSGYVFATALPIHLGRKTHVWDVRIRDEGDRLICISRCTVAVLEL